MRTREKLTTDYTDGNGREILFAIVILGLSIRVIRG